MKKVKILSFAALPMVMALLAGCGHEHTFSNEWTTNEEKHWHDATCEHKDQRKDEGAHIDIDNNGKCDICDYQMGTPTPEPSGEVTAEEWESIMKGVAPFDVIENGTIKMEEFSKDDNTSLGAELFEIDGKKAKETATAPGFGSMECFYEVTDTETYCYTKSGEIYSKYKFEGNPIGPVSEMQRACLMENFEYVAETGTYKTTKDVVVEKLGTFKNLVIKFENKKLVSIKGESTVRDKTGTEVPSNAEITYNYTPVEVTLPEIPTHEHNFEQKSDQYSHWKQCSCGEILEGSLGAHYDSDWSLTCDVCGYQMTPEVQPGYYFRFVSGGYVPLVPNPGHDGEYMVESAYYDEGMQFQVYNVTDSNYILLSLIALGDDDITKKSGVTLVDGVVQINEAGNYSFYLNPTGNGTLYVNKQESPVVEPEYAYIKNGDNPVDLDDGTDPSGNPQKQVENLEFVENETIYFANVASDPQEILTTLVLGTDDGGMTAACGFSISEGVLTASKAGTFSFYVKLDTMTVYISDVTPVETVKVTFTIIYETQDGQGVYLVGDFCNWDPTKGIRGTWTEGHVWVIEADLPKNKPTEYKFVINSFDEPKDPAIRWEADPNRAITPTEDTTVDCSWQVDE